MQIDFTISTYIRLLKVLQEQEYCFQTFEEYIKTPQKKVIILRHDVDKLPQNSLLIAKTENKLGIRSSYYFRIVNESNHPDIIDQIVKLGHEIGYHYEDLTIAVKQIDYQYYKKNRAKYEQLLFLKAFELFQEHLSYFRQFYDVKTISMHGSPLSKWDSRNIWNIYDYTKLGIIGEPYFDIDFSKVLYLTDTGRRWDGDKVNVRDKAISIKSDQLKLIEAKTTFKIMKMFEESSLPDIIMFNTHPQRWTNNAMLWLKELIFQNMKNVVKRFFFVKNIT